MPHRIHHPSITLPVPSHRIGGEAIRATVENYRIPEYPPTDGKLLLGMGCASLIYDASIQRRGSARGATLSQHSSWLKCFRNLDLLGAIVNTTGTARSLNTTTS